MKRKIVVGILALFVIAQFIQPSKNQGNPSGPHDIVQTVQTPPAVFSILKRSCYDCHSNYTVYPLYDHITPVNWWVKFHIDEGKLELNFTEFGTYTPRRQLNKLKEIAETIESDEMPLQSYLVMHRNAKLSAQEKQLVINWARAVSNEINSRKQP